MTVTLAEPVLVGETLTVDYTPPSGAEASPLRDAAGNEVVAFAEEPATNATADTTAPGFASAEVDGTVLTVTFDEALDADAAPAGSAFTVTAAPAEGEARSIAGTGTAGIEGAAVTVTLAGPVLAGETVTVAYTPPSGAEASPLRDAASNEVAAFAGQAVANGTAAAPSVEAVALVSGPGADATYAAGDTLRVQVTFGEAVTVDTDGGTPRLKLDLDPADGGERWAAYESGSGEAALVFGYAAAAGDASPGGVAVIEDTLEANGGTIRSAAGADAALGHAGLAPDAAHKVDGAAPGFASAEVGRVGADCDLRRGAGRGLGACGERLHGDGGAGRGRGAQYRRDGCCEHRRRGGDGDAGRAGARRRDGHGGLHPAERGGGEAPQGRGEQRGGGVLRPGGRERDGGGAVGRSGGAGLRARRGRHLRGRRHPAGAGHLRRGGDGRH